MIYVDAAERIAGECLNLRPGERAVVISDEDPSHPLLGHLLAAIKARGASAGLVISERTSGQPHGYLSWLDPPELVRAALQSCDVAVFYSPQLLAVSPAVRNAAAAGTRMLFVPSDFDLRRPVVLEEDLAELDAVGAALSRVLDGEHELVVSTPEGTNLRMRTSGPVGYDDCRVLGPGDIDFFPGGMWNLVPEVSSVTGTVRFCAALHPVGRLSEPIELVFDGGNLVDVRGGWQSRVWTEWLESFGEQDVMRFAHLSGGLAARAQVIGHDWEDLIMRGSLLVSGGASLLYGGANDAPAHFDGIVPAASLSVDGVEVLSDGVYTEAARSSGSLT